MILTLMGRLVLSVGITCGLASVSRGDDRLAEFEKLDGEYQAAQKAFYDVPHRENPTTDEMIARYEAWPEWKYVPKFLKLAEVQPGDTTAYKCCQWIVHRIGNIGNWYRGMYEADEKAWDMIAAHHIRNLKGKDYQLACFEAVKYVGPARERFLRAERARTQSSLEERAIATLALAELLSKKFELTGLRERQKATNAFEKYLQDRGSPDWLKDCTTENGPKFKAESVTLFREVLEKNADVPVVATAPYFRDLKTVGDKASKSLHALEHLSIGGDAPSIVAHDLEGKPLNLADFRGRVVLLVFWETSCGPCMEMIPQEQALVKKYQGRPFAMLGVCTDPTIELGQKTAKERGMVWPCWFDGEGGPIASDYNVLMWPTVYILDEHGVIAAKDLRGKELDTRIAEVMAGKK